MNSVFFNRNVLNTEKEIIKRLNVPSIILMENAGKNAAERIIDLVSPKKSEFIYVIAGKGNNAGDGFVISRHLAINGFKVKVYLLYGSKDFKDDCLSNYNLLMNLSSIKKVEIVNLEEYDKDPDFLNQSSPVIIDSLFGIGFKGEIEDKAKNLFSKINNLSNKTVISIDIVSGLYDHNLCEGCLKSDYTITMGVKKFATLFGKGKEISGNISVVNIGLPEEVFDEENTEKIFEIDKKDVEKILPVRAWDSNKYTNGKLFILTGSVGFTGASYLSSIAALRVGCGAVVVGIPKSLNNIMESKTTEIITLPLETDYYLTDESFHIISEKMKWSDAMLVGPGMGRNIKSIELIHKVLKTYDKKLIIDADGIYAMKNCLDLFKQTKAEIILTPHYGEFANLIGVGLDEIKKDFYNISKQFAKEYNTVLVLKNSPSVITDGKGFYINSSGKENLATVGTGDVLAGIISGLTAANSSILNAAIAGTFLHGMCGDFLYKIHGCNSTIASDLLDVIPKIKNNLSF